MYQPTLFEWMKFGGWATLVFLALILIKFFRKKPLPSSSNFLPLLLGIVHNAKFIYMLMNTQGMGPTTEQIISDLCETTIVTTLFAITLIFVDCIKSFIHRDRKKNINTQKSGKGEFLAPPPHTTGHAGPHPAVPTDGSKIEPSSL